MIDNLNSLFTLVNSLMNGGAGSAVIFILFVVIGYLIYDRHRLLGELTKKDAKIDKIIEDYAKGNITLSEALNSLKIVLYEIHGKLF